MKVNARSNFAAIISTESTVQCFVYQLPNNKEKLWRDATMNSKIIIIDCIIDYEANGRIRY